MSQVNERLWASARLQRTLYALLVTGVVGPALAQNLPDAQVESNVLRALATAPELANETITTQTVYGTVTLTGSVRDETARRKAETLTANAAGVRKVIDELRLGSPSQEQPAEAAAQGAQPPVLQSDGTYVPADGQTVAQAALQQPQRNNPVADQQLDRQREQQGNAQGQTPDRGPMPQGQGGQYPMNQAPMGQAPMGQPPTGQTGAEAPGGIGQTAQQPYPPYAPYPYGRQPIYNPNYPAYPQTPYPPQGSYPSQGRAPYSQQQGGQFAGGQQAGETVVIPPGAMVRVRINQPLSSNRSQPGSTFDGIVANDVVAGNLVAIPRGAAVQGRVIDARSSGVLKGRGEMQVQLTSVTLGGRTYPLVSDVWDHHGGDKTIETINKTAGFGAGGAVIGALAGGGVGAAVGGGIGAALGLGSSAASGNGQVYIPSEAMLTFHTAQDATITTVSEQEMQRLAYGVPAGAEQRQIRPRYPIYLAPAYPYPYYRYPGPYGPYGYPNY